MEKIKEIIGRYLPFAWWVLLALLTLCAAICCISQAAAKIGVFWGICGAVGTLIATVIFAVQAWGEWLEKDNY